LQKVKSKRNNSILVQLLVVARLVKFFFKTGKRQEGFAELDLILNKLVRDEKGYRGYVSMFSCDNDDVAIIITMWEDDESFLKSQELFSSTMDKVTPFFEKPPEVEHHRVDTVNFSTQVDF
jgi:quinol monooxygenase YgiN